MRQNKPKIAMIGQKTVPSRSGGIEQVLTRLCPLLAARGFQVACYNRRGEPHSGYAPFHAREYRGVRLKDVFALKSGTGTALYSFLATLRACFCGSKILHYHAEGPAAMLWAAKLFGKKCVVTVHGLDWMREKWQNGFAAKYIRFGEKLLAAKADAVIVLSQSAKRYFQTTYNRETIWIPNGADCMTPRPCKQIQERFGLQKDTYFCTVCRLTPEKGLDDLIEAHKMAKTGKKLVIAGGPGASGDYVQQLQQKAGGDTSILFTGFLSDELLEELYSNAFAFVLASSVEGMPLSLLEAMAYGCAVIGSDIEEIREVAGDCGLLYPCKDTKALAACMQRLCDDEALRQTCKTKSLQQIKSRYSWEKIAGKTAALYDALLEETQP